jgi:hypothetical protein
MTLTFSLPLAAQTAAMQTQNKKLSETRGLAVPTMEADRPSFTIVNPQHLGVPEARAQVLHKIVQDVAAEHLHAHHKKDAPPLLLVLGENKEHFTFGGLNKVDTIYLEKWDEGKFVATDVSLAVQRLLSADSLNQMVEEISHRCDRLLPVSVDELRKTDTRQQNYAPAAPLNPCLRAMTDASQIGVRCDPRPPSFP